jgi:outer membrane lipoprotein-sorting protein
MRRSLGLLGFLGVAAVAAASLFGGSTKLSDMSKALMEAKAVKTTYTVQTIGRPAAGYELILKKPNMARVETPTKTIVADGSKLTVLDKAESVYTQTPQTEAELKSIFSPDELSLFRGFFVEDAYKAANSRDLGSKSVGGATLDVVESTVAANGRKVVTYYINPSDSIARKSQIQLNDPNGRVTTIIDTKSLELNGSVGDDAFKFEAPEGARLVKPEELNAKWLESLDEARKVAAATKRQIFVDFYAEWCGPCKLLEAECFGTSEFKALSKKLVFLRIDVDRQQSVSQQYNIEAMPTQMILKADGSIVDTRVGYSNRSDFFRWVYGVVGR